MKKKTYEINSYMSSLNIRVRKYEKPKVKKRVKFED